MGRNRLLAIIITLIAISPTVLAQETAIASSIYCPPLSQTLSLGMRDVNGVSPYQISGLQKFFSDYYVLNPRDYVTGYFGRKTRDNVRKFQCEKMGICSGNESATGWGVVGGRTRAAIARACGQASTPLHANPSPTQPPPVNPLLYAPVSFVATPTIGGAPLVVSFSSNGVGNIIFGDGATGHLSPLACGAPAGVSCPTVYVASHTYVSPGTYGATLQPTSGSSQTVTIIVTTQATTTIDTTATSTATAQPTNCSVKGITVSHGASTIFYSRQTVPAGQSCSSYAQGRSCNNGTMTGDPAYQYATCGTDPLATFAPQQEQKYALPDSYKNIRDSLEYVLNSFDAAYLNAPLTAIATGQSCGGTLQEWSAPRRWAEIGYAAEMFRSGAFITYGDPEKPNLSKQLGDKFLQIANYFMYHSNATYFNGVNYSGIIGWNPWASSWDAFQNGTCSPATTPNGIASSHALHTLADAYLFSGNSIYLDAFNRGATYWFWGGSGDLSPFPSAQARRDKAASFGPYAFTPGYTVGGSHFSGTSADQLAIRYHYYYDDPGYFALNQSAGMGLAMTLMGSGSNGSFTMADGNGGTIARSYGNIGYWSMYPIYGNINNGNYGYRDMDDVDWISPVSANYEGHLEFELFDLARAGAATGNANFKEAVRQAALKIISTVSPSSMTNGQGVYFCLLRELDPSIASFCRTRYEAFKSQYGPNTFSGIEAATTILQGGTPH